MSIVCILQCKSYKCAYEPRDRVCQNIRSAILIWCPQRSRRVLFRFPQLTEAHIQRSTANNQKAHSGAKSRFTGIFISMSGHRLTSGIVSKQNLYRKSHCLFLSFIDNHIGIALRLYSSLWIYGLFIFTIYLILQYECLSSRC